MASDKGPWLRDLEPKPAGAMDGVTTRRHRAGCEDSQAGEPLAFTSLTTAKTAMDGHVGVKLENHHVLRLDCSTGKAGAVRVDEVQRR